MRYLLFLPCIPALILLYLSVHQEVLAEKGETSRRNLGSRRTPAIRTEARPSPARTLIVPVSERGEHNLMR